MRAIIKIRRGALALQTVKPPPRMVKRQRCRMPSGWPGFVYPQYRPHPRQRRPKGRATDHQEGGAASPGCDEPDPVTSRLACSFLVKQPGGLGCKLHSKCSKYSKCSKCSKCMHQCAHTIVCRAPCCTTIERWSFAHRVASVNRREPVRIQLIAGLEKSEIWRVRTVSVTFS